MRGGRRFPVQAWVWVVILAIATALPGRADDEAPAPPERAELEAKLATAKLRLDQRGAALRARIAAIDAKRQPATATAPSAPERTAEQNEQLAGERTLHQHELDHLESAVVSWQAAIDAQDNAARLREQIDKFREEHGRGAVKFVAADVEALSAQLVQNESAHTTLDKADASRTARQAELAQQIAAADEQHRPVLEAEQAALTAQAAAAQAKRAALDTERQLIEARLTAAREAVGSAAATQPAAVTTSTAPAREEEADALNKQRLAAQLEAEARDALGFAQSRLEQIQEELDATTQAGPPRTRLENERDYWQHREAYERRQLEQAELHQRAARQREAIAQLLKRKDETLELLEQARRTRRGLSPEQREERAAHYRAEADRVTKLAAELEAQAQAAGEAITPLQQLLPGLDAMEEALRQRLEQAGAYEDYQAAFNHYRRMQTQLTTERQQIDLMITTVENTAFALWRQAALQRELARLYRDCAEVLVPSQPTFWQRNLFLFRAMGVLVAVVVLSYAVKLVVWLTRRLIQYVNQTMAGGRISVKRAGTLVSFGGSIAKLFIWVFGAVWVLKEFGISPATTTGALGLIGLIMAGMFQQIVVDFVKGLDIIAGRHYNVGDFVEVDGKYGHVVDFNVKHTRLRTASGQELNLPNSRCLPSRRFPDGFVDNYVDVTLASSEDHARAVEALKPVCRDLNFRLEPVRDVPTLATRFAAPGGGATLRYHLQILPGAGWVVTDYFVPGVKDALSRAGVELAGEPTLLFINRIATFRKLFNRQLTEQEIIREAAGPAGPPAAPQDDAGSEAAAGDREA